MYKNGMGIESNISEARSWLRKAADQGNSTAIEELKAIE